MNKKDSKIVQSWILDPNSSPTNILTTLLCIYLNQYYINSKGYTSSFYTNTEFLPFISELDFTKIDTTTLSSIPLNNKFISYPKMLVLKDSPLGYVHVDSDIIIRNIDYIESILREDWDGISYNIERPVNKHIGIYEIQYFSINQYVDLNYSFDESMIFNVGFIGWKNKRFKDEFLSQYFKYVYDINNKYDLITYLFDNICKTTKDCYCKPVYDFIIEQMNYTTISKQHSYKIKTVLNSSAFHSSIDEILNEYKDLWNNPEGYNKEYFNSEKQLGIKHYFGDFKNKSTIKTLYYELKNIDNEFYYNLFIKNLNHNEELYNTLFNIVEDNDLISIITPKTTPHSNIATISKNVNIEEELFSNMLDSYNTTDLYIFDSNREDYEFCIKTDAETITSSILIKLYNELQSKYKWITFVDDENSINLQLLDVIKDIEKYDLILYRDTPIINTRLDYEKLNKDISKLNILKI